MASDDEGRVVPFSQPVPGEAARVLRLAEAAGANLVEVVELGDELGVELPAAIQRAGHALRDVDELSDVGAVRAVRPVSAAGRDRRREFISSLTLPVLEPEAVECGLDGHHVGMDVVRWANGQVDHLSQLEDVVGGAAVLAAVTTNLTLVEGLVRRGRYSADVEVGLVESLAQLARLAGWCAHDARDRDGAQRYLRTAVRAAESIGDHDFAAYGLSLLAFEAIDNDELSKGLAFLDAAGGLADGSSPLQIAIGQWKVQPLALMGQQRAATRCLSLAEERWERHDPDRVPGWLYWMLRPTLTSEVPRGFMTSDPGLAERLLRDGLASLSAEWPRDRVLFLMGLAEAQFAQGHLDEAVAGATQVVEAQAALKVPRIGERLRSFRAVLPADPVTVDLRERIDQLVG